MNRAILRVPMFGIFYCKIKVISIDMCRCLKRVVCLLLMTEFAEFYNNIDCTTVCEVVTVI